MSVCATIVAYHYRRDFRRFLETIAGYLEKPNLEWLLSEPRLMGIEERFDASEIWIVNPDLSNDVPSAPFREIVESNLKCGVKYVYGVPDTDVVRAELPSIQDLSRRHPGKVSVHLVAQNEFDQLAVRHIAIYNPRGTGTEQHRPPT